MDLIADKTTVAYLSRCNNREMTLMSATMGFVAYFMGLGDDLTTAQGKVSQVSTKVSLHLYPYRLGNTQPLIDAINASTLEFMDAAAKAKLTGDLTTV